MTNPIAKATEEQPTDATVKHEKEVAELRAFHDYFKDRCEGLFAQFGMSCIDLYNAAGLARR